jgi:DNA-binding SARP family transcriptional activator
MGATLPRRSVLRLAASVYDREVVATLAIRLLGSPEIERDGAVVAPPRGHTAWAVLAYVTLAERPVARTPLAGLIFGDAADPRGALRWTLAELRRALGVPGSLRGDPVEPALPGGAAVDVLALAAGEGARRSTPVRWSPESRA